MSISGYIYLVWAGIVAMAAALLLMAAAGMLGIVLKRNLHLHCMAAWLPLSFAWPTGWLN